MAEVEVVVYRSVGGVDLVAHIARPESTKDAAPGLALFHGGGLYTGSPGMFVPHCRHFADRGMVAASFQYRLWGTHTADREDIVADAQAALAWLRDQPAVDPRRVAAGGYSAGTFLSSRTAFTSAGANLGAPLAPAALVYICGVPIAGRGGPVVPAGPGAPPTLLLLGTRDPVARAVWGPKFVEATGVLGNHAETAAYDGAHTVLFAKEFSAGLKRMDEFLVDVRLLPAARDLDDRIARLDRSIPGSRRRSMR